MDSSTQPRHLVQNYKIHWHVVLIHFPISFYLVAFMFMLIYLFTSYSCFELTSVICIAGGSGYYNTGNNNGLVYLEE